jgi:hypothetical protein
MDFYANDSLGPWTVNNEVHRPQRQRKPRTIIKKEAPQADQVLSDEQAAHCCSRDKDVLMSDEQAAHCCSRDKDVLMSDEQAAHCCSRDKDVLMSDKEHKLKFVDNVTEIAENKS